MLKEYAEKISQFYVSKSSLPFEEVQTLQKLSAVNVILEAKSEISPFLPGKFPHCVMADKPILLLGPYYSECRRLLGNEYQFWAEIDEIDGISIIIVDLYSPMEKKSKRLLKLDRPDLEEYLSLKYLAMLLIKHLYNNENINCFSFFKSFI